MSRDEVVRISRLVAFGGLTEMDINILFMNYCLELIMKQQYSSLFS